MQKAILIALVLWAMIVANMPMTSNINGANSLTIEEEAGVVGQIADWNQPVRSSQPTGALASVNP